MFTSIDTRINELILKTYDTEFISDITIEKVLKAKDLIRTNGYSTTDFLVILSSINLLNASIKKADFKYLSSYYEIKGNVSRILNYFATLSYNKYNLNFYVNTSEKCAYVEIYDLQFSFHNININEVLRNYINSDRNIVKPWREIRLQKIAGELFDLALEIKESNDSIISKA